MELVILSESILYKKKEVHTLDWKMILKWLKKGHLFFFFKSFWQLDWGSGDGKWPYLRKVSKLLAGNDFKLHIKLIQGYALIKARAGNSYGFSSSLLGQHWKAINVLSLTQAASFQKISH